MKNVAQANDALAHSHPEGCPAYHRAIELIGKRWNGVILRDLLAGPTRFSELRSRIPGITDTMLAQRLRELEDAGLVSREIVESRPILVQYQLTEIGRDLSPILGAIASWSDDWASTCTASE